MKIRVSLRVVHVRPDMFRMLANGEIPPASVTTVASVLRHPKDRAIMSDAVVRTGLARETISRRLAPLRDKVVGTVQDGGRRGWRQLAGTVPVLDAWQLPVLERALFMGMQVSRYTAVSAARWAGAVFPPQSEPYHQAFGALKRLEALGLLRRPHEWSLAVAMGLSAEPAERIDIGGAIYETPAHPVPRIDMPAQEDPPVPTDVRSLLAQAARNAPPPPAGPSETGVVAECRKVFLEAVERNVRLPADMPDDDLALLLVGAFVHLMGLVRSTRIREVPMDVLVGAVQCIVQSREQLTRQDMNDPGAWMALARAGGVVNLPSAMLAAVVSLFGKAGAWRSQLRLREVFDPGLDGGWQRLAVHTLAAAQQQILQLGDREVPVSADPTAYSHGALVLERTFARAGRQGVRMGLVTLTQQLQLGPAEAQPAPAQPLPVAPAPAPLPKEPKLLDPNAWDVRHVRQAMRMLIDGQHGARGLVELLDGRLPNGMTMKGRIFEIELLAYLRRLRDLASAIFTHQGYRKTGWDLLVGFDELLRDKLSDVRHREFELAMGMRPGEATLQGLIEAELPEDRRGGSRFAPWVAMQKQPPATWAPETLRRQLESAAGNG